MNTFVIEWGCSQHTIMLFGLKNAPAIFSRIVVVAFKTFIHKFIEVYFDLDNIWPCKRPHRELENDATTLSLVPNFPEFEEMYLLHTF